MAWSATNAENGLTAEEARRRLEEHGPNRVPRIEGRSAWAILSGQFTSVVIGVLGAAGLLSLLLGALADGIAILAVLLLNGMLGFLQELSAERALAGLRELEAERATVVRDGLRQVIDASTVAPGDLVLLEAGERVPADVRLVSTAAFQTVEAALTGESAFAAKDANARVGPSAPLPDRVTMAYSASTVASGLARGVVVATGASTELGRIVALVGQVPTEPTPLQRELSALGNRLLVVTGLVVCAFVLLAVLRGLAWPEILMAGVGLAVAAIPEGLPAVVTVALAVSVRRMARRHVLVRRLGAVETLGSTTVICVDKTGTLTTGRMEVRRVGCADGVVEIDGRRVAASLPAAHAISAAAACTTATVVTTSSGSSVRGDPMEGALLAAAERSGLGGRQGALLRTQPFDAQRKRMSVVREEDGQVVVYVKGAPESVLPRCTAVLTAAGPQPLDAPRRARLEALNREMSDEGLRVLAVARRALGPHDPETADVESDLLFLGHVALQDPPRADSAGAVERCQGAGLRTVMITGDQAGTALAIARRLGVARSSAEVATGEQLAGADEAGMAVLAARTRVYARTGPEEKLRIVRALQRTGAVVAMTGDGVNDVPALKGADVGIAMGSGTESAKDVASIVVTDDRFASIVVAVGEGRTVHENVRKSLLYLLSGNVGELLVIAGALAAGLPLPLVPAQILWVNLVTDGLPALALATDPEEPDVLDHPPRPRRRGVAGRGFLRDVLEIGLLTAASTLAAFVVGLSEGSEGSEGRARTMAFSTLVLAEVLLSFVVRSRTRTIWSLGLGSNLRLLVVGLATVGLQLALLTQPWAGRWLGVVPLTLADLAWVGVLGVLPATALEVRKLLRSARRPRAAAAGGTGAPPPRL